ncbi:MAG TPA: acid--CoA ligase, partial [Hyphomonas sp.]
MPVQSMSRIISYWAARQADRVAIDHEGRAITWGEFEERTNRLARAYSELGVQPDDFVTIALPNGIEFFEACFAVWKLGATPQPISAKLPKSERDQIIDLGKPSLVVGAETGAFEQIVSVPQGFVPGEHLSAEPLPELTAASLKAMTSGGSTGRPKLIVSAQPAAWDTDLPYLEIPQQGAMLVPGP